MKLSQVHPFFYHTRIKQKQLFRGAFDLLQVRKFSKAALFDNYPVSCKKHQSLLRRKLGTSDMKLQDNKVVNLRIAIAPIDGILIQPLETFSFWKLVGKPTTDKGYIEGLLLSQGNVITGIGGGICQLANLLYWMVLHTPLQVVERHHHHFDPFPDDQRTLPFGSGASVFFNYVDLRFYNPTNQTFQIRVWLTENHLKGAIFTNGDWPYTYHIEERNHKFLKKDEKTFRENEIWKYAIDNRTGKRFKEELVMHNFSEIKYQIDDSVWMNTNDDHEKD
ncbi:MAG: vancomycin resistance protein [Bacilli bacterium]|nr:vancomycin resistance protein [Bacilli bacterium]